MNDRGVHRFQIRVYLNSHSRRIVAHGLGHCLFAFDGRRSWAEQCTLSGFTADIGGCNDTPVVAQPEFLRIVGIAACIKPPEHVAHGTIRNPSKITHIETLGGGKRHWSDCVVLVTIDNHGNCPCIGGTGLVSTQRIWEVDVDVRNHHFYIGVA